MYVVFTHFEKLYSIFTLLIRLSDITKIWILLYSVDMAKLGKQDIKFA